MQWLCSDDVPFATAAATAPLRQNADFGRHLLRVTHAHMLALPAIAEARHIKHSQSTFVQLGNITRILCERCVRRLPAVCQRYGAGAAQLSVDCLLQCLRVGELLHVRKFAFFLQAISECAQFLFSSGPTAIDNLLFHLPAAALEPTATGLGRNCAILLRMLQDSLDQCLLGELEEDVEECGAKKPPIGSSLLQCMELLLEHLPADDPFAKEVSEIRQAN